MTRKYLRCLVLGFILLLQAGCQEQAKLARATNNNEVKEPAPRITFEKLLYDFGEISPNSMFTSEIKFTNTGQVPLKIMEIEKCCGIVTSLDKDKTEYAPGEQGIVKVQWKLGPQPGVLMRQLIIHSNDRLNPVTTLSIHAKVVLSISWEPKRLILSPIEKNAGCPKITISSLDGRPFSIIEFQSTDDCVTADFDRSVSATRHIIEPKVKIEKLQKYLEGRIKINTTHPEGNIATILFAMLPEYTIEPPSILVFNVEPGNSLTKKIVLLNNYDQNFEIESVSSLKNVVAVRVLRKTRIRNGYQLEIEMTVPPAGGKRKFTDEFSVNLKDGAKLPLKCDGYYPRKTRRSQPE